MKTYLVQGFYRHDHTRRVCVVSDAEGVGGYEALTVAEKLDGDGEICFCSSVKISAAVPTELKDQILEQSELYQRVPELREERRA